MKQIVLVITLMFVNFNVCIGQPYEDLDSFFTNYFRKEVLKDYKIIIEFDSCIFINSSIYNLDKVLKVEDLKYHDFDNKNICFLSFVGLQNVQLEPEYLNFYLSFELTFKKNKNDMYITEKFTFLIKKNKGFILIYIDGLKPILIGKIDIAHKNIPSCFGI